MWEDLSFKDRSKLIELGASQGILDLSTIKHLYNINADGGYLKWKKEIAKHKGINIDNDKTYNYQAFFEEDPQRAWDMLKKDSKAHFTDKYKTVWHPTFSDESVYSGHKSKYNPQGLVGGHWEGNTFRMSDSLYGSPVSMDDRQQYLIDNEHNGVTLLESNGTLPVYDGISWGGVLPEVTITPQYSDGGSIHIAKNKRGTFKAQASRMGMSTQQAASHILANKDDYSPAMVKKAVFAHNFAHAYGGKMYDDGGVTSSNGQYHVNPTDYLDVLSNVENNKPVEVTLPDVTVKAADPKNYRSSYDPNGFMDFMNAVTLGVGNRFSVSQDARLLKDAYDAATGNKSWKDVFNSAVLGNEGIFGNPYDKYSFMDKLKMSMMNKIPLIPDPTTFNAPFDNVTGNVNDRTSSVAQVSYLLPRDKQQKLFEDYGYKRVYNDYGTVKRAAESKGYPIYQKNSDDASRENLVPIGNADSDPFEVETTYKGKLMEVPTNWYAAPNKSLIEAGATRSTIYYNPNNGKYYQKAWDLNDYGGNGGSTADIFGKFLDTIGNPVVVTSGIQEVLPENINKVEKNYILPYAKKHYLKKADNGHWGYVAPDVIIYGHKHAEGGFGDGGPLDTTLLHGIRDNYNGTVNSYIDGIYANGTEESYGNPSDHYNNVDEEKLKQMTPNARGHYDDSVKLPNHPSSPTRGTFNGQYFDFTDKGFEDPNYTMFGLQDNGDGNAIMRYNGAIVIPELTVTPNGNYYNDTYNNIKIHQGHKHDLGGSLESDEDNLLAPIIKYYEDSNPYLSIEDQNTFAKGGQMKKARQAVDYFVNKGLTREQAAGLVGNLMRESGMNIAATNPNSGAYGLGQWLGNRKTRLFRRYGYHPTFEQQLDYVWDELNTSHRRGLQMLRASKTVNDAARNAFGYYEFSAGPEAAVRAMNGAGRNTKWKNPNGTYALNSGIKNAQMIFGRVPVTMDNIGDTLTFDTPESMQSTHNTQPNIQPIISDDYAPVTLANLKELPTFGQEEDNDSSIPSFGPQYLAQNLDKLGIANPLNPFEKGYQLQSPKAIYANMQGLI